MTAVRIGIAVGIVALFLIVFPPEFWIETFQPDRKWDAGLPECKKDPTADADMERARVAGEEHARRQLARATATNPARHAKAEEVN